MTEFCDVAIIGAGAIGTSTAYHLAAEGLNVAVVEKEPGPALHQSGRNSGVIHAGYNPKPGTLKAQFCVEGNRQLREYCSERLIPVREGGILIVAQNDVEIDTIQELERRDLANGANVSLVTEDRIHELEPFARGIRALFAEDGASLDARAYVQSLASDANRSGAKLLYDHSVDSIAETDKGVVLTTNKGLLGAKVVVNAAGLYVDVLAEELSHDMRVIPFRGYYAELTVNKTHMVNSHIYAAPDLNFPFLGVHLSKRTDGRVIVGPGAMLAFGREAYSFASLAGGGLGRTLGWPGFYRMMQNPDFKQMLKNEVKKSFLVGAIGKEAIGLMPALKVGDFVRSYAGNRAQLVDRQGNMVDDIVVEETPRAVHVLNAVSPGLTCSLPFGKMLAGKAIEKLYSH